MQHLAELRDVSLYNSNEQIDLVVEMIVERAFSQAGALRNCARADPGEASGTHQMLDRIEQPLSSIVIHRDIARA